MDKIIQLLNKPVKATPQYISYYERFPLAQIHMDTMFYELTSSKKLIPILVIVDVATRYTKAYIQTRKNEKVEEHLQSFVEEVRKKWKTAIKNKDEIIVVTDGARELAVKNYPHKVSVSINKAVIAESAIKKIRFRFRRMETGDFLKTIRLQETSQKVVDLNYLKTNLPGVISDINKTARLHEQAPADPNKEYEFKLGDMVFAKSKEKFEGNKLGFQLKKKSYLLNYDPEPMIINRVIEFNNGRKYELMSLFNFESLKYYYYEEELQSIPPELAEDYVKNYNTYWNQRQTAKVKKNKLNWTLINRNK